MTGTILIIDNHDSFVFNVARTFEELGRSVDVVCCDAIDLEEVMARRPCCVVLSPGPGAPTDARLSMDIIRALSGTVPILGVCLGHQCIGAALGGAIVRAKTPVHGRASSLSHQGQRLFEGLASPLRVGRYHSLIVRATPFLDTVLIVDLVSEDGEIMALSHKTHPTFGVQFHPESILTEGGHAIFANFLKISDARTPHVLV